MEHDQTASSDTEDPESGFFENGIVAGDLDSLLEMFEEAESVLSSSVGCISLTRSSTLDVQAEGEPAQDQSFPGSVSEINLLLDSADQAGIPSAEKVQGRLATSSDAEIPGRGASHEDGLKPVTVNESDRVNPGLDNETVSENISAGDGLCSECVDLQQTTSNDIKEHELWSSGPEHDRHSNSIPEESNRNELDSDAQESNVKDSETFRMDDSGTSSEWDNDLSLEDKWSDSSSSSPSSKSTGRGRTSIGRRDGPRRQQGRGRTKPAEEEKLYDRLPSYYTIFSRPNRTATGLKCSSRSCMKMVLDSASLKHEPSLDGDNQVFDKVPSYQSCFTNSTRYDEATYSDVFGEEYYDLIDNGSRYGRGHGSRASYECSRSRFRSRSRLRATRSPRHQRSGRTFCPSEVDANDRNSRTTTGGGRGSKDCSAETNQSEVKQDERRILYIGRIPSTMTADRLKEMFERFGPIDKCTVHFREYCDNYGFVTYTLTSDAYRAVEEGTGIPGCHNYDICFGGRRKFCRADYFDHDGNVEMEEELAPQKPTTSGFNFDDLLMDALLQRKRQ